MHVTNVQNTSNIARDNIKTIQCSLNPTAILNVAIEDDVAVTDSSVVKRLVPLYLQHPDVRSVAVKLTCYYGTQHDLTRPRMNQGGGTGHRHRRFGENQAEMAYTGHFMSRKKQ